MNDAGLWIIVTREKNTWQRSSRNGLALFIYHRSIVVLEGLVSN